MRRNVVHSLCAVREPENPAINCFSYCPLEGRFVLVGGVHSKDRRSYKGVEEEISTWSENQVFDALMKQVDTEPIGAWGEICAWDWITTDERKVFRAGRAQAADQYAGLHPYRRSR